MSKGLRGPRITGNEWRVELSIWKLRRLKLILFLVLTTAPCLWYL